MEDSREQLEFQHTEFREKWRKREINQTQYCDDFAGYIGGIAKYNKGQTLYAKGMLSYINGIYIYNDLIIKMTGVYDRKSLDDFDEFVNRTLPKITKSVSNIFKINIDIKALFQ